jgi:hypothetical protein
MQKVKFSNIATHTDPAWGKHSNWMLHADLEKDGLPERGEQIWAKQLDRSAVLRPLPCGSPEAGINMQIGDYSFVPHGPK